MIKREDLEEVLQCLDSDSSAWLNGSYVKNCEVCASAEISGRFLKLAADLVAQQVRAGGDVTRPMIGLAATMLEAGYKIGRKHAEVDTLNSWLEL